MDKFTAIKMFVSTVENKGFSAAARQLGVATSSVSRMIDALEAELETALLNRTTRLVTVTDAGEAYYSKVRQLIDDMAEADSLVRDNTEEISGPLKVTLPATFGRYCVSPHLGRLMATYPKLELDLILTDEIVDLQLDRIDLSIRLGKANDMEMVVNQHISNFERYLVASPEYLSKYGNIINPTDLSEHHCLLFSYGSKKHKWRFTKSNDITDVSVQGPYRSNNIEVIRDMAVSGGGFALLPDWLINDEIKHGRLVRIFDSFDITPNNASSVISALFLPNHRHSARVHTFITFITAVLNGDARHI